MPRNFIAKPHTMKGRVVSSGRGFSFLLNGPSGPAATLTADAPSPIGRIDTTPAIPSQIGGLGLGKQIGNKLANLKIQGKRKPENISFSI